ncbi:hypothetical protein EKO27_g8555 [Xylaria grammica]|uniref:Uncharacterized protein n=1 Tax=Xylaria grammica TaxID=363999 RepID=A0A439CWQ4_9PEZI|nr:hypothetical protein EKO27_g8555 [Xylaria grammica]
MAMGNSWWDDFSNNLATDLAPLVALFGEAPTKQYLSECLTPEDIVIFAIAPLGIITAVVSAIRVRGTPSLKAFVGRAQEGAGTVEVELCSSTSRDVCELDSNGGIARVSGRPKLLEVVHDHWHHWKNFPSATLAKELRLYTHSGITEKKREGTRNGPRGRAPDGDERSTRSLVNELTIKKQQRVFAPNPNLSINIRIKPLARD